MKSVLLYLVLVGTPLLGLLGIIEAGERLTPPQSVGGDWQLADESARALAGWCAAGPVARPPTTLTVSQSGTYLELAFDGRPKRSLSARLDGDAITGAFALPDWASCPGHRALLRARVGDGDRMIATLRGDAACPGCPALQLEATRRPPPSND
jgi:hypothetical protein